MYPFWVDSRVWCKIVIEFLFFFFACTIPVLPTSFIEETLYLTAGVCHFGWILIDHKDMVFFLGSLFCSIDLCFCSYASTRLFRLQCLYHSLVSGIVIPPTLFFFSQDCRSYLGSIIWFDIYFWNIGSRYVKHTTGIFIRIALNL